MPPRPCSLTYRSSPSAGPGSSAAMTSWPARWVGVIAERTFFTQLLAAAGVDEGGVPPVEEEPAVEELPVAEVPDEPPEVLAALSPLDPHPTRASAAAAAAAREKTWWDMSGTLPARSASCRVDRPCLRSRRRAPAARRRRASAPLWQWRRHPRRGRSSAGGAAGPRRCARRAS